jgi:glycosyltransferase involved in cell wall biosynthesis
VIYDETQLHCTENLISIFIPALNEEAVLKGTISSIPRYGNCTDLTREIAL